MSSVISIRVCPVSATLNKGEWFYGAWVNICPSYATDPKITWHSEDPSVAGVSETNGYIYGVGAGTTRIYAETNDGSGCIDYITVTVKDNVPVTSVSLSKTALTVEIGSQSVVFASVSPSNATNRQVKWTTSNSNVATVYNGVVTGVAGGTARITATAVDGSGKSASCDVTVVNAILVTSIDVCGASTMQLGSSQFLCASVSPYNAKNKGVSWSSNHESVAWVNPQSGLVMARRAGTATITATAIDGSGVGGSFTVTVIENVPVTHIELSADHMIMDKGDRESLSAVVSPSDATNKRLCWSSDNPSVASVSTFGVVTAVSCGSARIYAAAKDGSGVEAHCDVDVRETIAKPDDKEDKNTAKDNSVADPVNAYTGAHEIDHTVMSLFGGQGLKLTAHYRSNRLVEGALGIGWSHDYEKYLEVKEGEILVYSNPSTFSRYAVQAGSANTYLCQSPEKAGYVLTVDHSQTYPYRINCNFERTEYYNACGDLVKLKTRQGFETLISETASLITVTDCVSGKKLYLEKDATCKIVRVYDDTGRSARLSYSGNHLTSIGDANGNSVTFTYDAEGRILTGTDAHGTCYFTNTYDKYGRVITQKDGVQGSLASTFVYDGNKRIVTNRNGKPSVREYNDEGLLIKHTDENGNTKAYAYDSRYNIIKETDAKGNSVCKVYDSRNRLIQVTDKNGNMTCFMYDEAGNLTKIYYPKVNGVIPEETFVYNAKNQLVEQTDLGGTVTVYTYDASGMPATKKTGSRNAVTYSYENGLLKSQTDAKGNTTSYTHNALGQVSTMTDADNKVTSYTYDAVGNLLKTVDANGNSVSAYYNGNNQKSMETDANGNSILYSHTGNLKVESVDFPDDGTQISYVFDGEDRMTRMTDRAGNVTEFAYDNGGRMISKRLPDGILTQYEYDEVGNVTREIAPTGAVTVKTYDAAGNVLSVTDNEGNVTRYQYNAMSKLIRAVNSMAGATVYEYAASGELLSETDALGNKQTYTYDAFGNRLSAEDAKGNLTLYTYDAVGNLLTVKDALNHVTTYTYNALNQCISVKDALNHTVHYGYDALGRRTTVTDAKGNIFTSFYDGNGNVVKTTDARGNVISETEYDAFNLPLAVTDAMGKVTRYTYNAQGKVASVTDPMGFGTEYTYNSRGQNTSVRDAKGYTSSMTYDALGNVTRIEGPLGGATEYSYDDMGRLIAESTVSGGRVSYTYNELNVRESLTNARGQQRKLFYDAKGRITGYISPEDSVSYTYDANGNVLTVTDRQGRICREYDALNRVTKYTDTMGNVLRYEYDAVGNLTRLIYPDDTAVTYAYDANRKLISVTDWANRVTSYTYNENNKVVGITKPNGSVTTKVYDSKQRLVSVLETTARGMVIQDFEYTYDDMSRVVEEKTLANSKVMCYTYDELGRVTSRVTKNPADCSVISAENYTYDAAGNLLDAPCSCFAYDTNNRLTSYCGRSVSYDMDGNMTNDGISDYTYDSANRLIAHGGNTYTYNAEDVRIQNGDTTYVYDTVVKLSRMLTKTENGVTTKYVYGLGLIGEECSTGFKTYHFDSRGSTIAITDAGGNFLDTLEYDTYGKLISHTGSSNIIFGYNGRDGVVTDDNGLIYMRARYYSPDMRRFINADIIAGKISNAITLNRFAYANGNPVSFVDPFGLSAERGMNAKETGNFLDFFFTTFEHTNTAIDLIDEAIDYLQDGFRLVRKGKYVIVKGARSASALRRGIRGTKYLAQANEYWDVLGDVSVSAALKSDFLLLKSSGKINGGAVLNYLSIGAAVVAGIAENVEAGTRTQKIFSDAIVDAAIETGISAASTAAGAFVGSFIPIPVLGTAVGAGVGYVAGEVIDLVVNADFIAGKSMVDWTKEGAGWVADRVVDAGEWIGDAAVEAWDATTDFVDDAGEWIADTASNVWNETTRFLANTDDAIGNLFSGIFG